MKCLLVLFDAPMSSFGGDVIDNRGVVRDFPGRSMLAGLLGNALGYDRSDAERLDRLQSRLVHAAVRLRNGRRERDYQTARLFEKEVGWTTRGRPEGRATSPSFSWDERYERERGVRMKSLTHQRYRDFDADAATLVALSLDDDVADAGSGGTKSPDIDLVAAALDRPERPLFLGRKSNLPATRLSRGTVLADSPAAAIAAYVMTGTSRELPIEGHVSAFGADVRAGDAELAPVMVLAGGFEVRGLKRLVVSDERRHAIGVHAGGRTVLRGWLHPHAAAHGDVSGETASAPEDKAS